MRCGRLNCRTPDDEVKQVKGVTLCVAHRLMCFGQLEPASPSHRLTQEQRAAKFKAAWKAKQR